MNGADFQIYKPIRAFDFALSLCLFVSLDLWIFSCAQFGRWPRVALCSLDQFIAFRLFNRLNLIMHLKFGVNVLDMLADRSGRQE